MSDPIQLIFNIAITIAGFLSGFILNVMWRMQAETRRGLALTREEYMRRDSFEKALDGVYVFLRRIEDKLDGKADRK